MSRNLCLEQLSKIFSLFYVSGSVFFPGDTKMSKTDSSSLVERKTLVHCGVKGSIMSVRNSGISKMTSKQKDEVVLVCRGRRKMYY